MTFKEIKTPEQLMKYLDQNFKYGVIDKKGNKYYNSNTDEFQRICETQWELRPVEAMLKAGVGHCYDQVEIEREWFSKNGYNVKTFWLSAYQDGIQNSGFCHTYLMYQDNDTWKIFEHSDFSNKGIFTFKSISDAVKWQAKHQIKFAESCIKPLKEYVTCIKEYNKPPTYVNMQEFSQFIDNSKDYVI